MPYLKENVLKRLMESDIAITQATIFSTEEKMQHFRGIYKPVLRALYLDCYGSNERSIKSFLFRVTRDKTVFSPSGSIFFKNVNRPADLDLSAGVGSPTL